MLASTHFLGAPVTRLASRTTLVFCSLIGLAAGCGQDETVRPAQPADDAGSSTENPGPGPTPPSTVPTTTSTTPPPAPTGPSSSQLGAACARTADCGAGLLCLTATGEEWLGGGPPNGFCSADCNTGGDELCGSIEADSLCVGVSDTASYCIPTCTTGSAAGPKCQDRPDVACDPVVFSDLGVAICRPMCRGDEDCNGRLCDFATGSCVDDLPTGDPLGSSCNPETEQTNCSTGFCLGGSTEGTTDVGYCTGWCTVGAGGCGSTDGSVNAGDSFCLPAWSGTSVGDLGLCVQTCDCDADCDADRFRCGRYPDAQESLGVQGFCFEFDAEFSEGSGIEFGLECSDSGVTGDGDAMSQADTGLADAEAEPNQSLPDSAASSSPLDAAADSAN